MNENENKDANDEIEKNEVVAVNNQELNVVANVEAPANVEPPKENTPAPKQKRMKNGTLIWLIVLTFVVVVGAVQVTRSLLWDGGTVTVGHVPNIAQSFAQSDVTGITTDLSTTRVYVTAHSGSDILIHFEAPNFGMYERPLWEIRNDGTLHIYNPRRLVNIQFMTIQANGTLHISIPRDLETQFNRFDLEVTTGRIVVNAPDTLAHTVNIRTTTGRVEASNISAQNLNVRATTGRVELNNINVENLDVSGTTGRVEMSNITAANSISARTNTGRIEARNINASNTLTIDTTTGRVVMNGVEAGTLNATTTTGRVEASRLNTTSNATIRTTTGRIELSNSRIDGDLYARATTGRIELSNTQVQGSRTTNTTTGRIRTN